MRQEFKSQFQWISNPENNICQSLERRHIKIRSHALRFGMKVVQITFICSSRVISRVFIVMIIRQMYWKMKNTLTVHFKIPFK